MVREKDFYSPTDRQGKPKPGESAPGRKDNGSCPFCHKLEIKVLKTPSANQAVIQRRSKKADEKRHLYVGFLKGETQHPEEFYMPCCFTEDTTLYSSEPRFDKVRPEEEAKDEGADAEAEADASGTRVTGTLCSGNALWGVRLCSGNAALCSGTRRSGTRCSRTQCSGNACAECI